MPRNKNDLEQTIIKLAKAYVDAKDDYDIKFYEFGLRHAVRDLREFEEVQEQLGRLLSERSSGPITSVPLLRTP